MRRKGKDHTAKMFTGVTGAYMAPTVAQMVKNLPAMQTWVDPWIRNIPWRRKWQPTPVFLPGKAHWQRSLVGYSPWGRKESDVTERLHFTSLQAYNDSTTFVISRHTLHVKGDRRLWAHQFSEAVASHSGLQMLNFSNILSEESPKIHCSTLKGDAGDTSAKELQHRSSDKNQTVFLRTCGSWGLFLLL